MKFNSDARFAHPQLLGAVKSLHRHASADVEQRVAQAGELIEQYVTATGQRPEAYCLQRLADYILLDDLTDINKHRKDTEYPYHTGLQTRRRDSRQAPYTDAIGTEHSM
jgi:hypothetical protein